jgi:hypothetical protein
MTTLVNDKRARTFAYEVKVSEGELYDEIRVVKSAGAAGELSKWEMGRAFSQAETAHFRRCLASAKRTGADPRFYLENLNRWNRDGDRAQIGNLGQ